MTPDRIRETYDRDATEFWNSDSVRNFRCGSSAHDPLRAFIANVFRTHYNSPHILAFLFSSLPSDTSTLLRDNLLEEIGLTTGGISHPSLLIDLAKGAGFSEIEISKLVSESQEQIRRFCSTPLPFSTLRDLSLSVLLETEAFEFLLSRYASPLGAVLHEKYQLPRQAVQWFDLHSEVDIRHVEEGLRVITDFLAFYRISKEEFERIHGVTFQTNVFLKRYFPETLGTPHTFRCEQVSA